MFCQLCIELLKCFKPLHWLKIQTTKKKKAKSDKLSNKKKGHNKTLENSLKTNKITTTEKKNKWKTLIK